jgi:hypothetical protein
VSMIDRVTPIGRHRLIDNFAFFDGHAATFKRQMTRKVRQCARRIITEELEHSRDAFDVVVVDSPQPVTAVRLRHGLHDFLRR